MDSVFAEPDYNRRSAFPVWMLLLIVSTAHLIWILYDTRPQPFLDPYPQKTLVFFDNVNVTEIGRIPRLLNDLSQEGRPPLYQLLAVPFLYLFGRSVDSLLLVNIFFGIILLLAVYGIGKTIRNSPVGLLAALFMAAFPPIISLTKIFRPHSALPACSALSLFLLFRFFRTRSVKSAVLFGLSCGGGVLIHLNFFYLLPGFLLAFIVFPLISNNARSYFPPAGGSGASKPGYFSAPAWFKGLGIAMLAGSLPAAAWYLPHLDKIFRLIRWSSSAWTGIRVGFEYLPASFWWYAATAPGAISLFFTGLLVLGLVYYLVKHEPATFTLSILFIGWYCGLSWREGTLGWMNFAPALSCAAVICACFLGDIRRIGRAVECPLFLKKPAKIFSVLLIITASAVSVFIFAAVNFGFLPAGGDLLSGLGAAPGSSDWRRMAVAFRPDPPRREDWKIAEIIARVIEERAAGKKRVVLTVVSRDLDHFNSSVFKNQLVLRYPDDPLRIQYIRKFDRSLRINWIISPYLVYLPRKGWGPDPYARAVTLFLNDPSPAFRGSHRMLETYRLPDGRRARLLKRIKPTPASELSSVIERLEVPEEEKEQLWKLAQPWF